MEKHKCFFCDKDATHYDVVVDHADYIVADVCFKHLSMGLVSQMNERILNDGSEVDSFDKPVDLIIHTKAPGKWKITDLETGEEYLGSEIGTDFAEILREKVKINRIGTWVKTKGKQID